MIWREPRDHYDDCYFCKVSLIGINRNNRINLIYLNLDSDIWLVCNPYNKHPCFLCLWDSRAKEHHWLKKDWPVRENMLIGKSNVINKPLVSRERIILPPLHIKLGLMKQFVKALQLDGPTFTYLVNIMSGISIENWKQVYFMVLKSENWWMTRISKISWMWQSEKRGFHLSKFRKTFLEITRHQTMRKLFKTCLLILETLAVIWASRYMTWTAI